MRPKTRINEPLDMLLNQTLRQLLLEPIPQKLRRLLAKRRETWQRAVVLHQTTSRTW